MNGFEAEVGIPNAGEDGPDVFETEDHPKFLQMFQIGFKILICFKFHRNFPFPTILGDWVSKALISLAKITSISRHSARKKSWYWALANVCIRPF